MVLVKVANIRGKAKTRWRQRINQRLIHNTNTLHWTHHQHTVDMYLQMLFRSPIQRFHLREPSYIQCAINIFYNRPGRQFNIYPKMQSYPVEVKAASSYLTFEMVWRDFANGSIFFSAYMSKAPGGKTVFSKHWIMLLLCL